MKVTVENKKGLNKDLKIFVDKKTMNSYMNERYEEIKGTVNLKGFRPGKVPREILKRQFGQAVFSEVLDKVLKETSTKALEEKKIKPEIVYSPPSNDLNKDHQIVYESALVVTRPHKNSIKQLFCYEIPGLVKEPFKPNVYVDITKEFISKIKAFNFYKSEIQDFPNPRSIKTLESLALLRGMESGLKLAESFQLIKRVVT